MANTMTLTSATHIPSATASHTMRPRTLAPWATSAYATSVTMTGVPFAGIAGVEAGVRGTDVRDSVALQGAPPRENPR